MKSISFSYYFYRRFPLLFGAKAFFDEMIFSFQNTGICALTAGSKGEMTCELAMTLLLNLEYKFTVL